MATTAGEVVYRQGYDDDNSDVWDDSALIKAYDEAITSMREGKLPENKKNRKSKKSKSKSPRNKVSQLRKGCKCKFFYENEVRVGEVASVDESSGICEVVYGQDGENSVELLLNQVVVISEDDYEAQIKLLDRMADRDYEEENQDREEEYTEEAYNIDYSNQFADYYQQPNNYPSGNFPQDRTAKNSHWNRASYHQSNYPNYGANNFYPNAYVRLPNAYPPPPPPPVPPMHMQPPFQMPPFGHPGMSASAVPPLPPQPPPLSSDDINDELLSNLIMSWYMAGYRTGYYQAIRKAKDKSKKK
ncbi:Survival motor neuron protein [Trichoplax sp. H2]|nr:Survival motor neuron protein [Trichoplax sp. H2]|eukprot:RDD43760.1 Survival motor neuron protein [Trichoplax sp. H2]